MEKRLTMILACLFLSIGMALAQTQVTGVVTSAEDGEPVMGASVKVVGTNTGTMTNAEGRFALQAPANARIEISYIGLRTQTLKAAANMRIVMEVDDKTLTDLVVTGYGSAKKLGSVVGAVATVGNEKLEKIVTPNFTDALSGQVSGLSVLTATGEPSASATIRLRGVNSITSSNTPLFILDGAPISSTMFNSLNPADIANITVLKDASSTAIYGSRAANGVIVITSRKGRYGDKVSLTLRAQYGVSSAVSDKVDMMNSEQYIKFRDLVGQPVTDYVRNLVKNYGFDTNWHKEVLDNAAPTYTLDAVIQGGSQNTSYYLSFNHHSQDGIVAQSGLRRQALRANIDTRLNEYFKVGFQSNFGVTHYETNNEAASDDIYGSNPMVFARHALPYDVPYYYHIEQDATGEHLVWGDKAQVLPYGGNHTPDFINDYRSVKRQRVTANFNIYEQLTPIKGLTLRAQQALEAYDYTLSNAYTPYESFKTPMGTDVDKQAGLTQERFSRYYAFTLTHTAEYKRSFDQHNFTALVGQESILAKSKGFSVFSEGQTDPRQIRLIDGTSIAIGNLDDTRAEEVFNSWFATLDYNFAEKYYATLTYRADGSSRFAPNHRWGNFYSIGGMWNAKKENFLQPVEWLNQLEVRLSYGTTGNASGAGSYDYFGLLDRGDLYNGLSTLGISTPSNYQLTWEKVAELNAGFTARVFDRLTVGLDFYKKKTSDMLMGIPYSYTTAHSSGRGNIGGMTNTGFDLDVNVDIMKSKDFLWTFKANVNYNKNKITELFAGRDEYVLTGSGLKLQVGKPYGEYYTVRNAGVDPQDGASVWLDANGNRTKAYDETSMAVFTGKQQYAPWSGGFGTSFQWKDLTVSADFSWQADKWLQSNDMFFIKNTQFATSWNQCVEMLNVWTTPGQVTDIPKNGFTSQWDDHLLEDASFLRLKNLTIQYALPTAWLQPTRVIKGVKVFGIARNLLTFTKFSGYDPEPDINIVKFNYPNTRQFVMGLEVTF